MFGSPDCDHLGLGHWEGSAEVQHSHSEAGGSAHDLGVFAHGAAPGSGAHWAGLVGCSGSDWTLGAQETPWGRVQWEGTRLRMCGSPAGAAQGLLANPAGLLHAQMQCYVYAN